MDIRKLQRAIVDGLEDVKAQEIAVFNTEHLSPLFERVIIASGTSNRQTKALAASVRDAVRGSGFPVMRTEGEENGEWIIVDCGAAVAHIMQPDIRRYYHLEEIWGGKAVKMKLGVPSVGLVKASDGEGRALSDGAAMPAVAKRPAAKSQAPAAKTTAAKTTAGKTTAPGGAAQGGGEGAARRSRGRRRNAGRGPPRTGAQPTGPARGRAVPRGVGRPRCQAAVPRRDVPRAAALRAAAPSRRAPAPWREGARRA
jgi:ribosome-associated protein